MALLAAGVTGMLVGAAMVSTRSVSSVVPVETLAFLRYAIGLLVLVPAVCRRWTVRFRVRDLIAVSFLGVMQFAVLILLLNYALAHLPAGICALVFSTVPLLTMCIAIATRQEAFSWRRGMGAIVAVLGIAILLRPRGNLVNAASEAWAWAALIGATLVGAACSLSYRPYLRRYPALYVSVVAMVVSVVFLVAVCLIAGSPLLPRLAVGQWGHVIFIGLSSGVGYFCLLWALSRVEASRVMSFQALAPITAVVIEVLSGSYDLTWLLVGAFGLVLFGVWFGTRAGGR